MAEGWSAPAGELGRPEAAAASRALLDMLDEVEATVDRLNDRMDCLEAVPRPVAVRACSEPSALVAWPGAPQAPPALLTSAGRSHALPDDPNCTRGERTGGLAPNEEESEEVEEGERAEVEEGSPESPRSHNSDTSLVGLTAPARLERSIREMHDALRRLEAEADAARERGVPLPPLPGPLPCGLLGFGSSDGEDAASASGASGREGSEETPRWPRGSPTGVAPGAGLSVASTAEPLGGSFSVASTAELGGNVSVASTTELEHNVPAASATEPRGAQATTTREHGAACLQRSVRQAVGGSSDGKDGGALALGAPRGPEAVDDGRGSRNGGVQGTAVGRAEKIAPAAVNPMLECACGFTQHGGIHPDAWLGADANDGTGWFCYPCWIGFFADQDDAVSRRLFEQKLEAAQRELRRPVHGEAFNHTPIWRVVEGEEPPAVWSALGRRNRDACRLDRLAAGSVVRELARCGHEIFYSLLSGGGPGQGWVAWRGRPSGSLVAEAEDWDGPVTGAPALGSHDGPGAPALHAAEDETTLGACECAGCSLTQQAGMRSSASQGRRAGDGSGWYCFSCWEAFFDGVGDEPRRLAHAAERARAEAALLRGGRDAGAQAPEWTIWRAQTAGPPGPHSFETGSVVRELVRRGRDVFCERASGAGPDRGWIRIKEGSEVRESPAVFLERLWPTP